MTGPVIEVERLVKKYDGRAAVLDDVSFSVDKAEFVSVYGKSGCGKTTLLNILGGLDRPTSGSVKIDGLELAGMSEDSLAALRLGKVGFVFQDFNLLDDLTVRDNIALPLRISGRSDGGRVDSLLSKFDLKHLADEPARRISGGEAQRTAIARAMTNNPKIILADEPTGNLDSENTEIVVRMLQTARSDFGTTVVLATHDTRLARHPSKRIALEGGRVDVEIVE